MEGGTSPDAKRARTSADGGQTNSKNTAAAAAALYPAAGCSSGGAAAAAAAPGSMTARSRGAAPEGEPDPIFDDPVVGEEIEGLMGDPPSVSDDEELAAVRKHAIESPETVRAFIKERARSLAIGAGCPHSLPLVTWKDDPASAVTCGKHQAHLIGNVDLQVCTQLQQR